MRNFHRPLVPCISCGAKIYWEFSPPEKYDDDTVSSHGWRPPDVRAKCPRCGAEIDTTVAFASIAGFPPSIESLKKAYAGFVPVWEPDRESFEAAVQEFVKKGMALPDVEQLLNEDGGFEWYRQ